MNLLVVASFLSEVKVAQLCPTLCDPMDYIVHGILQAKILDWVAFPFSSGSSQPRNQTGVSCIVGGFFTNLTIRESCRTIHLVNYFKSPNLHFVIGSVTHFGNARKNNLAKWAEYK